MLVENSLFGPFFSPLFRRKIMLLNGPLISRYVSKCKPVIDVDILKTAVAVMENL